MSKDDRTGSAVRGVAFFVAAFALVNVLTGLRTAGRDANAWWIDLRPMPPGVAGVVVAAIAVALGAWATRPRTSPGRRVATVAALVLALGVAALNVVSFYRLRAAGTIATPAVVPFSVLVVIALAWILRRVVTGVGGVRWRWAAGGFAACAVGFPLAQVGAFGWTDYRRPAAAIVVLGARAYADGTPSDALEDRVLTAVELYKQGLSPRLIFSGGPGDGAATEAAVMRRVAIDRGVPASAIILDDAGLTTDATVGNVARLLGPGRPVLVVSHGWHLPRVKMRCDRAGLAAFTVPADERGRPLRSTPYLVAREVPAIWWYYVRGLVG